MIHLKAYLLALLYPFLTLILPAEKIPTQSAPSIPPTPSPPPIIDQLDNPKPSVKNLTLESIFSSDYSKTNSLPENETITLITTGDVIPARSVNWTMTKYHDFTYPFQKTADFLKQADLTLINLEAPLIPGCPVTNEGMVFCGSQRFIKGLTYAGIDVANLANNHSANWGLEGLCQTIELLSQNKILPSGYPPALSCLQLPSSPSLPSLPSLALKGLTLGFLGFNLLDLSNLSDLSETVRAAKASGIDFLIVSLHWGAEYQRYPSSAQVQLAHQLIEAGADLIVGNHPHWFQPIEIYQNKLIIFAHGNFIFDQEWNRETKTGFIAKHTIYKGRLINTQILPIFIQDYSQPYFLEGDEKGKVLAELARISQK